MVMNVRFGVRGLDLFPHVEWGTLKKVASQQLFKEYCFLSLASSSGMTAVALGPLAYERHQISRAGFSSQSRWSPEMKQPRILL